MVLGIRKVDFPRHLFSRLVYLLHNDYLKGIPIRVVILIFKEEDKWWVINYVIKRGRYAKWVPRPGLHVHILFMKFSINKSQSGCPMYSIAFQIQEFALTPGCWRIPCPSRGSKGISRNVSNHKISVNT